jgi:hypothetical protein
LASRPAGLVTLACHEGAIMTFSDEPAWRGTVYQGGWARGAGGDAFTEPRGSRSAATSPATRPNRPARPGRPCALR